MLPLGLLNAARKTAILVEVKNGETFNGTLDNCDVWMNLHLLDVIKTSAEGDRFWKLPEVFIRGSSVKYIRLPEERAPQMPIDASINISGDEASVSEAALDAVGAGETDREGETSALLAINKRGGASMGRLRVTSHTAVFTWHWDVGDESVCGICQCQFETACPTCTLPGDDCPLLWGGCKHTFHMHCIVKWLDELQQQQQDSGQDNQHCPMCRQPWRELLL